MGFKGKQFSELRCGRCNWDFGNIFHICLDPTEVAHRVVHPVKKVVSAELRKMRSEAAKKRWAEGRMNGTVFRDVQMRRWDLERARNVDRDRLMAKLYMEGNLSIKELGKQFDLGIQATRSALQRMADEGRCSIRPRGLNVAYDKGAK